MREEEGQQKGYGSSISSNVTSTSVINSKDNHFVKNECKKIAINCLWIIIISIVAILYYRITYKAVSNPTYSQPVLHPMLARSYNNKQLTLALEEIYNTKKYISTRWDVANYPAFFDTLHIPEKAWGMQVNKFIELLTDSDNKGRSRKGEKKSFVMSFTGSSVTAGHDNFFNESFPIVVQNTLQPVFNALGIHLEVCNYLSHTHSLSVDIANDAIRFGM